MAHLLVPQFAYSAQLNNELFWNNNSELFSAVFLLMFDIELQHSSSKLAWLFKQSRRILTCYLCLSEIYIDLLQYVKPHLT